MCLGRKFNMQELNSLFTKHGNDVAPLVENTVLHVHKNSTNSDVSYLLLLRKYFENHYLFFFEDGCAVLWNVTNDDQEDIKQKLKPLTEQPHGEGEEEEEEYPSLSNIHFSVVLLLQ